MSGSYGGQGGQWEAVQRAQAEEIRLAREGRYADLGRAHAERLEREEAERTAEGLRLQGVRREREALQARANQVGSQFTQDQLDQINARYQEKLERMPGVMRGFSTDAAAWLLVAQEFQREQGDSDGDQVAARRAATEAEPQRDDEGWLVRDGKRVLDDQRIREMDVEAYLAAWDPKTNQPREGYAYEPGGGEGDSQGLERALLANSNLLASGLGSGDVDVQ